MGAVFCKLAHINLPGEFCEHTPTIKSATVSANENPIRMMGL